MTEQPLSEFAECDNMSSFHNGHLCPNQEDCTRIYPENKLKQAIQKTLKELEDNMAGDVCLCKVCRNNIIKTTFKQNFGDELLK